MATWSPLTNKVRESKDNSGNRKYKVTRITPHCWVGQVSIENGLDYFATTSRQVSSNYIIGSDGRVGGCVREEYRAWTSSIRDNDNRAITIECASDTKSPYAFKTAVYEKLVLLCADICRRYGKKKLLWFSDKSKRINYSPKDDEMVLTLHRDFASTDCPGAFLVGKMNDLATRVTAILGGGTTDTYTVKTNGSALRLRAEPNTSSKQVGYINNGTTFKSDKVVKGQNVGGVDTWVYYKCGYASGKYLSPTPVCPDPTPTPTPTPPTPTPTPTPTGMKYICTAKSGVNIRAGAGTGYKKVGAVDYGQTVTIYTQKNGWGNMTTSGNRWVCMKYFKAK